MDDRAFKSFEKEIQKDKIEIEKHKIDYANQVRKGLGHQINDINSYIKPEPTRGDRFKGFISKVFKHL